MKISLHYQQRDENDMRNDPCNGVNQGVKKIRRFFSRPSAGRRESNRWLLRECSGIQGDVLSIGSENGSVDNL